MGRQDDDSHTQMRLGGTLRAGDSPSVGQVPLHALWYHSQWKQVAELEPSLLLRSLNSVCWSVSNNHLFGGKKARVCSLSFYGINRPAIAKVMQSHWVWSRSKGKRDLYHCSHHRLLPEELTRIVLNELASGNSDFRRVLTIWVAWHM